MSVSSGCSNGIQGEDKFTLSQMGHMFEEPCCDFYCFCHFATPTEHVIVLLQPSMPLEKGCTILVTFPKSTGFPEIQDGILLELVGSTGILHTGFLENLKMLGILQHYFGSLVLLAQGIVFPELCIISVCLSSIDPALQQAAPIAPCPRPRRDPWLA